MTNGNTKHTAPLPLVGGAGGGAATARNAWLWIPTLYFAEGLPYFIVNNISVTMFTKMGVPNGEMALFTSLLYLPWTIKPLWSPLVDLLKTKRWWILAMQILMSIAFILLTLSIPHPDAATIAAKGTPVSMFTITLLLFIVTAFASATHDIAADGFYMLAMDDKDQSFFVGIRSTFYRLSSIFGQGVLVYVAGVLETRTGNIPLAWQITMGITAVMFSVITIWHTWAVPRPARDVRRGREGKGGRDGKDSRVLDKRPGSNSEHPTVGQAACEATDPADDTLLRAFGRTFVTFFQKPGVWLAIAFMLVYRLPEAFLLKMVNPFLLDGAGQGGLALGTSEVGIVYGTIGVLALTIGGIIGGMAASKWGLKGSLWPMAACMTLPCLTFVYLSMAMPHSLVIISICVAVEQFGYGFGFTAYMLYMMHFSRGEFVTAHYAVCTAFMALSMMIPGMFAGYLQEAVGYEVFFWIVMACCLGTVVVTTLVRKRLAE